MRWKTSLSKLKEMSLIQIGNKKGPSTEPCGTPVLRANKELILPSLSITVCSQLERYDANHLIAINDRPASWSLWNKVI